MRDAHHQQKQEMPPEDDLPTTSLELPDTFAILRGTGSGSMYTLNETESSPALWLVSSHSGWLGKDHLIVHSEQSEKAPALASVRFPSTASRIDVMLPAGGGQRAKVQVAAEMADSDFVHPEYSFSLGGETTFVWRHRTAGMACVLADCEDQGWVLERRSEVAASGKLAEGEASSGSKQVGGSGALAAWSATGDRKPRAGGIMARVKLMSDVAREPHDSKLRLVAIMSALSLFERERRVRESKSFEFSTSRPRKDKGIFGSMPPGVLGGTI